MPPTHPILDPAALTVFDGLLLLIFVLSTVFAFQRGIIRVLFSLGGVIVGFIVASWNYLTLGEYLHRWVTSEFISQIAAFFLIFVAIILVVGWLAGLLHKAVKGIGLGFVDRLLGAGFGVLRGILLGVAVIVAALVFAPNANWLKNSELAPYFLAGAHAVSFVVPEQFAVEISKGATSVLRETPELMRPHTLTQPD